MNTPFIVRPGEGRILNLGNFEAVVLADGPATSGALSVLQTQGEPTDFGPPMHVHRDAAEAFYVLEGTYLMYVEERRISARLEPSYMCRLTCHTRSKWFPRSPERS
jgi:mannose-6-phosphate isomerase-like protein (cupin superfamily)